MKIIRRYQVVKNNYKILKNKKRIYTHTHMHIREHNFARNRFLDGMIYGWFLI